MTVIKQTFKSANIIYLYCKCQFIIWEVLFLHEFKDQRAVFSSDYLLFDFSFELI